MAGVLLQASLETCITSRGRGLTGNGSGVDHGVSVPLSTGVRFRPSGSLAEASVSPRMDGTGPLGSHRQTRQGPSDAVEIQHVGSDLSALALIVQLRAAKELHSCTEEPRLQHRIYASPPAPKIAETGGACAALVCDQQRAATRGFERSSTWVCGGTSVASSWGCSSSDDHIAQQESSGGRP